MSDWKQQVIDEFGAGDTTMVSRASVAGSVVEAAALSTTQK
jgi:hypothetical protein